MADVRKISDDEVETIGHAVQQATLLKIPPLGYPGPVRILPRQSQCFFGNIDACHPRILQFGCETESDNATAGTDIGNLELSRSIRVVVARYQKLDQLLSFRPRYQRPLITPKAETAKFGSAEQVLKRPAFAPLPNEFPKRSEL